VITGFVRLPRSRTSPTRFGEHRQAFLAFVAGLIGDAER
jgi:hypothetical protein